MFISRISSFINIINGHLCFLAMLENSAFQCFAIIFSFCTCAVFISLLWNLIVWICQKNKWKLKGSFLYWNKVFLLSTVWILLFLDYLIIYSLSFVHLIIIFHSSLIACTCTLESYDFQIHNFQDFKGS